MDSPPRKPTEKMINREMVFSIVFVGLFMAIGTLYLFSTGLNNGDYVKAQTFAFVAIALFQVFNALNCRSRNLSFFKLGPLTNKWLLLAILGSFLLQYLVTELPIFQVAFGTTSLAVMDWVVILLVSSSVFIAEELRKFLVRNRE